MGRSRASQILRLVDLKPEVQEALLLGETDLSEGQLRVGGQAGLWADQVGQ